MTKLHMYRAARAANSQPHAIAIYTTNSLSAPALPSLLLTAAFGAFLWAFFLTRAMLLLA